RSPRNHTERIHRVHLKRVCDPGPTLDVFCGRGDDGSVRVPALRAVAGAGADRDQDAALALLPGANGGGIGCGGGGDCDLGGGVVVFSAEEAFYVDPVHLPRTTAEVLRSAIASLRSGQGRA